MNFRFFGALVAMIVLEPHVSAKTVEGRYHRWEPYVRDFRSEHNVHMAVGVTSGYWKIGHFGSLQDESFSSRGSLVRAQYAYHLQIFRNLGYLLGSSAGYLIEDSKYGNFQATSAVQFPGLLVGLVWNFSKATRLTVGLDTYVERYHNLRDLGSNPVRKLDATFFCLPDWMVTIEFFQRMGLAAQIQAHWRRTTYQRPRGAVDVAVDAALHKEERWITTGLTFHFL